MSPPEPPRLDAYFLNVVKPRHVTSAKVVNTIKRAGKFRRVGHAGTLDPLADGVLPVAVGGATRMIAFLHGFTKSYVAVVMFGISTTTDDLEGRPVARSGILPSPSRIRRQLRRLVGVTMQEPPSYSAVRVAGKRAYAVARAGEIPELAGRRGARRRGAIARGRFLDGSRLESRGTRLDRRRIARVEPRQAGCRNRGGVRYGDLHQEHRPRPGARPRLRRVPGGTYENQGRAVLPAAGLLSKGSRSFDERGFVGRIAYAADTAGLRSAGLALRFDEMSRFLHGSMIDVKGATGWNRVYDYAGRFLGMGEVENGSLLRPKVVLQRPEVHTA